MSELKRFFRNFARFLIVSTLLLLVYDNTKDRDLSVLTKIFTISACVFSSFFIGMNVDGFVKKIYANEARRKKLEGLSEYRHLYAIHEAGHAVVSSIMLPFIEIKELTIAWDDISGGHMELKSDDILIWTKKEVYGKLVVSYGGGAAEEFFFENYSTGARGDLKQATELAKDMLFKYGFGDKLMTLTGDPNFDRVLIEANIDKVEFLCKKAYEDAKAIIVRYQKAIENLAELLEEKEVIYTEEIQKFMFENNVN